MQDQIEDHIRTGEHTGLLKKMQQFNRRRTVVPAFNYGVAGEEKGLIGLVLPRSPVVLAVLIFDAMI